MAEPSRFETDDSRYPIVIVRVHGDPSDEQLAQFLAGVEQILKRPAPRGLVFDVSRGNTPPAHHRRAMAHWLKAHAVEMRTNTAGLAFIFTSAAFRFVLSTVFLIQPLPCPHTVCATEEAALEWVTERLRKFKAHPERNK